MEIFTQILGLTAGAIFVSSSLPQVIKIIKSQKTTDLSLPTYILINIGNFLWIIYGLLTKQIAIILPNVISQIFKLIILFLKIKHG